MTTQTILITGTSRGIGEAAAIIAVVAGLLTPFNDDNRFFYLQSALIVTTGFLGANLVSTWNRTLFTFKNAEEYHQQSKHIEARYERIRYR